MAFKNIFKGFSTMSLFISVLALIILTQAVSLLISSIFGSIPILKTGSILIILSVGLILIFIAQIVFKGEFNRSNILALLLLGTLTVLMYIYGSNFFPQIFSFIDSSALESAKNLQSILKLP